MFFPTGFELKQGMIQDTNTPFLKHELEERGYYVTVGEVMEDNVEDVVEKLDDALSRGFGLIVTTGGVGAEDKDHSVEGVCRMDPTAATPYIVKFQQGTGRHVKDGVRIGVGVVGPSRMVALPGPHDEVMCAAPVLLRGLEETGIRRLWRTGWRRRWQTSGGGKGWGSLTITTVDRRKDEEYGP